MKIMEIEYERINENAKDNPLHQAIRAKDIDFALIKSLVSNGADVNAKDDDGYTPLNLAVRRHYNLELVKFLVSQGADVNVKDKHGCTPLHEAAKWNENVEVVKFLVSQGADVNAKNDAGCTPLHGAAFRNKNVEVVNFLVSKGADMNAKSKFGSIPLHGAARSNTVEVVEFLVSQGADVNMKDDAGYTPLHRAVSSCSEYVEYAEIFCSEFFYDGCDTNALASAIREAKKDRMIEVIKFLIENGADVNAKANDESTPLHIAAHLDNSIEVIKFLICKGADVHAQDHNGKTASARTDSEELRLYLLEQENSEEPYMTDERKAKTKPLFSI